MHGSTRGNRSESLHSIQLLRHHRPLSAAAATAAARTPPPHTALPLQVGAPRRMDFYLDFHKHWFIVGPLVLYGRSLLLDTPLIACGLVQQWRQCVAARPAPRTAGGR